MPSFLWGSLLSGAAVSLATTVTLAGLARLEGKPALQPLNATSHWRHGDPAGRVRRFDIRHTIVGYVTHFAASVFWAAIFQAIRRTAPGRAPLADAVGLTAVAAVVDYGVVPERLTPGWEKVVSPKAIAVAYAAMTLILLVTGPKRTNRAAAGATPIRHQGAAT